MPALDPIILVSAGLLGALAAGYGILSAGDALEEAPRAAVRPRWSAIGVGLGTAAVLFLVSLLRQPPFSAGGGLGIGVLVGALTGAAAAFALGRARGGGAPMAAGGLSLLTAAGTMLAFRGDPVHALFGLALGQAIITLFAAPSGGGERDARDWSMTEVLPLMSALLAAGVSLAIARYREFSGAERLALGEKLWWTGPMVVCGSMVAGQIVGQALGRGTAARLLIGAGTAALILGVFAVSYPRYLPLLPSVAAGYLSGALLIALAATPGGPASALLGAGLTLALLVVAYRFTAGYGIVLAALGLAAAALCGSPSTAAERGSVAEGGSAIEATAPPLTLVALALLALAALFRVYYVRYGLDETSVYLTAHYTLIGLIAGALTPQAIGGQRLEAEGGHHPKGGPAKGEGAPPFGWSGGMGGPWGASSIEGTVGRIADLGMLFALPALMVVFWGIRACAGLLLGLSLGQAYLLWVRLLEGEAEGGIAARVARAASAAPMLILGITCVQALFLFDEYAGLLTRTHRIAIVLVIAALFPLAILLRAIKTRRAV